MKITNINRILKNADGLSSIVDKDGAPLTLKGACVNAILNPLKEDDDKTKFEKWEVYKLFRDAKDDVALTLNHVTIVKKAVGILYGPLVMGQIWEIFENETSNTT